MIVNPFTGNKLLGAHAGVRFGSDNKKSEKSNVIDINQRLQQRRQATETENTQPPGLLSVLFSGVLAVMAFKILTNALSLIGDFLGKFWEPATENADQNPVTENADQEPVQSASDHPPEAP